MHIQIDSRNPNSIISYSESQLMINGVIYTDSVIVSAKEIMSPWETYSLQALTQESLSPMVKLNPELILIGQPKLEQKPPPLILEWLSKQRIGLECMSIGAASRTFNVLLSEGRSCVAGFIFGACQSS